MVVAKKTKLVEYRLHLANEREGLIERAHTIKDVMKPLDWHDTQRDIAEEALNDHFYSLNKLITAIDRSILQLDELIDSLDDYFRSVKNLDH